MTATDPLDIAMQALRSIAHSAPLMEHDPPMTGLVARQVAEQTLQKIADAVASATDEAPEQVTGCDAVLRMRDEFNQLAQCYLKMHEYSQARDALTIAELLEKFEDHHIITEITWPAETVENDGHHSLKWCGT
jgi:hypothetical protein